MTLSLYHSVSMFLYHLLEKISNLKRRNTVGCRFCTSEVSRQVSKCFDTSCTVSGAVLVLCNSIHLQGIPTTHVLLMVENAVFGTASESLSSTVLPN